MEITQEIWTSVSHTEETDAVSLLQRATRAFGDQLLLATSLGPQSLLILDLAYQHGIRFDVALIDTGLLFAETLALADEVEARYGLSIHRARSDLSLAAQAQAEGDSLWLRDPDRCCDLRKVAPMRSLLSGYRAWLTGLRREQSPDRQGTEAVEWDASFGLFKLSPLVDWSAARVRSYLHEHQVPYNPLLDEGYRSVGCTPCTVPSGESEDERAGRWAGHKKSECGLHKRPLIQIKTSQNVEGE